MTSRHEALELQVTLRSSTVDHDVLFIIPYLTTRAAIQFHGLRT
jgi:hypothetical protein